MQKEYLFYTPAPLDFPLDEAIALSSDIDESEYLIANEPNAQSQVYAPEINFYANNTEDPISKKITNIKKLYDARACVYDLAQYMDYEQAVGDKLLFVENIGEDFAALADAMSAEGFTCINLPVDMIKDVNGTIGQLKVTIEKDDALLDLQTDQILWSNAPLFAMKQNGTFDPALISLDKVLEKIRANKGTYAYKNFVKYDTSICQYHERREETCGKCAEVCPTVAILKIDEQKHLEFSHVDCHGCGGCVSVCPSGALDYAQMPRSAFTQLSAFYADTTALITPRKMELENLNIALPAGVLPLAIEGEKYLHEAHLLTLLQTSGNPIIFYTDFISKGTGDVIRIINEIFERKYDKKAIFVCANEFELEEAFTNMQAISECKYGINEDGLRKREIFSARLSHLVGEDDLGVITTGEHVHYGNITINTDVCTLCLSCVGACNVRALTAHPEDNTLRYDPSICTTCGFCEFVCPEPDCLSVTKDELTLNRDYFKQNIKAHDEIFKCVECGTGFATVKSVEKIAKMMEPVFKGDPIKTRSLYCCASCKPKIMLQAQFLERGK